MPRSSLRLSMLAAPGLLAAAIALQACNSTMTDAGTPAGPSFTLTAARDTVRLAPGASATTSITATRAGVLTTPIIYATFTESAGLSASIAAADAGDSATLIITVTGRPEPGTYPITVNAVATGALSQRTTV